MSKIFISYRRNDSQYVTDAIYLQLKGLFGEANVFLDVGNIPFGVDFRQYLREQIEAHDVVLVIIGPDWAKIMKERAEQANDFVRLEVENALKLNKLIIPVLVMNAAMPDFSDLPASIADLQWRNNTQIRRNPDLEGDCKRLAEGIKIYFDTQVILTPDIKQGLDKVKEILPEPFDWCEIQAGQVTLEASGYLKEKTTFDIPTFYIAKYPITNCQYREFIMDNGYSNVDWWNNTGWLRFKDLKFSELDNRFLEDAKPALVEYLEAMAFCFWLSKQAGIKLLLPSDKQWQRAAQGNDERDYPWGNDWDITKANISGEEYTDVRKYEDVGMSPFGVADMVGNACEWIITNFYTGDSDIDCPQVMNCGQGVGGSYFDSADYHQITARPQDFSFGGSRLGFRIVWFG